MDFVLKSAFRLFGASIIQFYNYCDVSLRSLLSRSIADLALDVLEEGYLGIKVHSLPCGPNRYCAPALPATTHVQVSRVGFREFCSFGSQ